MGVYAPAQRASAYTSLTGWHGVDPVKLEKPVPTTCHTGGTNTRCVYMHGLYTGVSLRWSDESHFSGEYPVGGEKQPGSVGHGGVTGPTGFVRELELSVCTMGASGSRLIRVIFHFRV